VLHKPTGETWVVAFVERGLLACCGWPFTMVPLEQCEMVKAASKDERDALLREMAAMYTPDPRRS
jgi:hypothetical protein